MTHTTQDPGGTESLEYFMLGRKIRQGVATCASSIPGKCPGDVFYLWIQLNSAEDVSTVTLDQWLNIIDEAASIGVNWLVVTLGDGGASRDHVSAICRWAWNTYEMVVCVHAPDGELGPAERELLRQLPPESTYLLVEPGHASAFEDLRAEGVNIGLASPAPPAESERCEYPHKMIFVDAAGRLYTCGLVSGEGDFFLGSVFGGSLDQIIHNPTLPHAVSAAQPNAHQSCSGCPPLVAKYLCQK